MKHIRFALLMTLMVPALAGAQKAAATDEASRETNAPRAQEERRSDSLPKQITIRGFGADGVSLSAEQEKELRGVVKALKGEGQTDEMGVAR